ncbi:hypothetical protein [Aeromonas dhakensis]|nr:hypothetical protein [Aeromonas dhakensis]HDT5889083.1 hypothetical protein [Aeromonas dhakensis]HEB4976599.1 hypothetical protein [Aeromonas dhakensis]
MKKKNDSSVQTPKNHHESSLAISSAEGASKMKPIIVVRKPQDSEKDKKK